MTCDGYKDLTLINIRLWIFEILEINCVASFLDSMLIIRYCDYKVYMSQLSEDGPGEEPSDDDSLSSFNEWVLPAKEFDGMWERFDGSS